MPSDSNPTCLVFTSAPDAVLAEKMAQHLVGFQLAACVKQLPASQSTYHWEGRIEHATEIPLVIVTTAMAYPALERYLKSAHPYDVPEILALDCSAGLPDYLRWVTDTVRSP